MEITKELIVKDPIKALELMAAEYTDEAIAILSDDYLKRKVSDLDDKEGLELVHTARMDIKGRRVSVTKLGKELRDVASAEVKEYCASVLKEERRIVALLEPIETHLETEENRIKDEKERIKNEARLKEEAKVRERTDRLFALGMTWNGVAYVALEFTLPQELMKAATDEQFETFYEKIRDAMAKEIERKAAEEKARELESLRLAEIEAENPPETGQGWIGGDAVG